PADAPRSWGGAAPRPPATPPRTAAGPPSAGPSGAAHGRPRRRRWPRPRRPGSPPAGRAGGSAPGSWLWIVADVVLGQAGGGGPGGGQVVEPCLLQAALEGVVA